MSDQPRPADEASSGPAQTHPGNAPRTTPKSEPTEEESRVPREEARASRDCAAQPPSWDNSDPWDNDDVFQGGRGVVEERGHTSEGESDNLARRLNEFLERQGRHQSVSEDEFDRRFEEEMNKSPSDIEEDELAGNAEGERGEEPRAKMPRTETQSISLAPGIEWDTVRPRKVTLPRVFDKKALHRLGMVDHFAKILPVLSGRFSVHKSVPDFELPPEHDCWKIWPL
eukprot:5883817-Amphidinium_carterae.1